MKKKLYNVVFPVWMILILFPTFWLIALPANFLIDTIVLLISFKLLKIGEIKNAYKKTILKVWIFGFIADIIGSGVLTLMQFIPGFENIVGDISYDPFSNVYAILLILMAVIISMIVIYALNMKFSFNKVNFDEKTKKKLAIILAIFTAPYLFFMPSKYLYNTGNVKNNNIAPTSFVGNEFSGDTITSRIFAESKNYTNADFKYIDKIAKVNSDIVKSSKGSIINMTISANFDENVDISEYKKWAKQCSIIVFIKQKTIDEVVVNLKDLNGDEVCNLSYLKNELENEYNVKISSLENDSIKLQEILDSIK